MFEAILRLFKPKPAAPRPMVARPPAPSPERGGAEATPGVGARRPLVAPNGALAGFEFHINAPAAMRLRRASDAAVARAYTVNVLGAMRLCTAQKLAAFTRLPVNWLLACEEDSLFTPGMQIEIGLDSFSGAPAVLGALVERLRAAGVGVGWRPAPVPGGQEPPGRPDFVVLVAPDRSDLPSWKQASAAASARWPGVPQVLLDAPDVDVMESLLHPPLMLAACAVSPSTAPARVQALPPQAQRLLRLLNRLVRDEDNALLVADIKSDAAICVRLLHYLNSAGASPGRQLDSIDQAVMVLGRDALYGWVAQMLVRLSPPRPSASGLQAMAIARARLLEALARRSGGANPGTLYLLGLASMLPLLLQTTLADAVDPLNLPADAMAALREMTGPWAPYLSLVHALENQDMAGVEEIAGPFGGPEAVLACWAQAWLTD